MSKKEKILRQLNIYYNIMTTKYHGPSELIRRFGISKRTLHRDLDDLRDSGLLNLRYDRKHDNYVPDDEAPKSSTEKNVKRETCEKQRRNHKNLSKKTVNIRRDQHLKRLYRLGKLIFSLTPTDTDAVSSYYYELDIYHFYFDELMKEDPDSNTIENAPDRPVPPEIADLKAEYYELFPDSGERTRQRDFETLTKAGFPIHFDRRIGRYIYELFIE
ncbi:MAG: HTH domain-containing protein [Lachnospiraceae bacterium]|nr:HTH domain-containing protein [Lachnospiraceae bacterium]